MGCEGHFGLLATLLFCLTFGELKLSECISLGSMSRQGCLSYVGCCRCGTYSYLMCTTWTLCMCLATTLEEKCLTLGGRVLRPRGIVTI
jgi:hypothetical protein